MQKNYGLLFLFFYGLLLLSTAVVFIKTDLYFRALHLSCISFTCKYKKEKLLLVIVCLLLCVFFFFLPFAILLHCFYYLLCLPGGWQKNTRLKNGFCFFWSMVLEYFFSFYLFNFLLSASQAISSTNNRSFTFFPAVRR